MDSNIKILIIGGDDTLTIKKRKEQFYNDIKISYSCDHFDSTREEFREFLTRLITPSLFGDTIVAELNHLELMNKDEVDELIEIIPNVQESNYLFISYEPKKGSPLTPKKVKAFEGLANVIHEKFKKPREYEMGKWLPLKVREKFGRDIDDDAVKALVAHSGNSLDVIEGELEKIDTYLPKKERITVESVALLGGDETIVTPSDIANSVGRKEAKELISQLADFYRENKSASIFLTSVLYNHFWLLYKIRAYAEENRDKANRYFKSRYKEKTESAGDIGVAVGFISDKQRNRVYPAMIIPKVIEQAQKYSLKNIKRALKFLSDYDRDLKGGGVGQDRESFEELSLKIIYLD